MGFFWFMDKKLSKTFNYYYKFTLHFETLLKKYIYFLLFNLKDFAKLFCEKIIIF